jgi:NDP-sugar pyrophosphorylase family protein
LPQPPTRPLLVINGDLVTQVPLAEMGRYHEREGNAITIATKVEHYIVPYGVIKAENSRVLGISEKPKLEFTVSIGAYMLDPAALKWMGRGERLDMPELIDRLLKGGKRVGCFPVHEYWLDVGTPEQYARANHEIAILERGQALP